MSIIEYAVFPRDSAGDMLFPDPLPSLEDISRKLIKEALDRTHGNRTLAARMIGVSRQTLHRRLKET